MLTLLHSKPAAIQKHILTVSHSQHTPTLSNSFLYLGSGMYNTYVNSKARANINYGIVFLPSARVSVYKNRIGREPYWRMLRCDNNNLLNVRTCNINIEYL